MRCLTNKQERKWQALLISVLAPYEPSSFASAGLGLAASLCAFAAGLSAVPKCDRILYEHISPQTNTEHLTSGKSSILEDGF
jgi:hypothetical protein